MLKITEDQLHLFEANYAAQRLTDNLTMLARMNDPFVVRDQEGLSAAMDAMVHPGLRQLVHALWSLYERAGDDPSVTAWIALIATDNDRSEPQKATLLCDLAEGFQGAI